MAVNIDVTMIPKKRPRVFVAATGLVVTALFSTVRSAVSLPASATATCDPGYAAAFTPRHPVLGRYEACADPRPLADVAPADWVGESLEPADAFGAAGAYDHIALARLYGGRRPRVARGWTETADRFEATTLISPHPDPTLATLESGTLVIRWICDRHGEECRTNQGG